MIKLIIRIICNIFAWFIFGIMFFPVVVVMWAYKEDKLWYIIKEEGVAAFKDLKKLPWKTNE